MCDVEGCSKPVWARTLCQNHYSKWYRHGNPDSTVSRPRHLKGEEILKWYGWTVTEQDCWEWPVDKLSSDGYGRLSLNNKSIRAHRFAWEIWVGPLDAKDMLLHSCDNRRCINPKHLRIGNYQDNVNDMFLRGRANKARGEKHGQTKLTLEEVEYIRAQYALGVPQARLSELMGAPKQTINNIVKRRTWQ